MLEIPKALNTPSHPHSPLGAEHVVAHHSLWAPLHGERTGLREGGVKILMDATMDNQQETNRFIII